MVRPRRWKARKLMRQEFSEIKCAEPQWSVEGLQKMHIMMRSKACAPKVLGKAREQICVPLWLKIVPVKHRICLRLWHRQTQYKQDLSQMLDWVELVQKIKQM